MTASSAQTRRLSARLRSFITRNEGYVLQKAAQQVAVRCWRRLKLYRVLGPVLRERNPETWLFLGGCYNSGTTILREMIGAHPDVATLPHEGVEMTDAFPNLEAGGWVRMWHKNADLAALSPEDFARRARRARKHWAPWWRQGARVFFEKSIHHGAWMPELQASFPNAKFITLVRHGACVCEGIARRAKPLGAARAVLGQDSYPLALVAQQWVASNRQILRDQDSLTYHLPLRYETLADHPVETLRTVFRFLGLSEDVIMDLGPDLLHEEIPVKETPGEAPPRRLRIGTRSFRISNQNAASLARLSAADQAILETELTPLMTQLGYVTSKETSQ